MRINYNNMHELKKFFMRLYKPTIGDGNNINNNENIVLCYKHSYVNDEGLECSYMTSQGYNNIDDLCYEVIANNKYLDCYFSLSTSVGDNRKTEDMRTRTFLAFDFDEELSIDEIQRRFREVRLFYHAIVSSGHGRHVYICIEPTNDLELVQQVTNAIIEKVGADKHANTITQLLRVPYTRNVKNKENPKYVSLWHCEDENTIKRKNINKLASRFLNDAVVTSGKTIKLHGNCKKVDELLLHGAEEGNRHNLLIWLYGKLLATNETQAQIDLACERFATVSGMSQSELLNELDKLHKNGRSNASCYNCQYSKDCYKYIESDFEFTNDEELLCTNEKIIKKCKKKGAKNMNGNMLVVYGVLRLHNKGLYKEEIQEELTFRKKNKDIINVAMKDRTLKTTLKQLEEQKLVKVETIGRKKLYTINNTRTQEELNIIIRASIIYDVIKGYMTTEEAQFYCFLRYLQNEQRRINTSINGNKFIMSQEEIGKKYGVTRKTVNELIAELERKKYIRKEYRQSTNNGYDYCIYYLVH